MEQQGDDVASWWPWNVFEVLVSCYGDVMEVLGPPTLQKSRPEIVKMWISYGGKVQEYYSFWKALQVSDTGCRLFLVAGPLFLQFLGSAMTLFVAVVDTDLCKVLCDRRPPEFFTTRDGFQRSPLSNIIGSISPEGFLPPILLLVVMVVIVAVILVVVVVAIVGVVVVVGGVSFIIKLSFVII
ncbi:hypothetical protein Tco_1023620 [Tanacetum coccineum]